MTQLDIERSLTDAHAHIDDAISLTRGRRVVVDVNERQADGSLIKTQKERVTWDTKFQPMAVEKKQAVAPIAAATPGQSVAPVAHEQSEVGGNFAVMAPYWVDGLHNAEGVALAAEINKTIQAQKLAHDKEAIARLLAIQTKAGKLGLGVVPEVQYLSNKDLKNNPAEPIYLLDKALVRDKEGGYRPAAGGLPVLLDKGDSVVLKSKGAEAYRGAMELAQAKGWRDVELKGKPAMLADAWLEAKLMTPPINVINYQPTAKDIEKYTARVAELSRASGIDAQETVLTVRPAAVSRGEHIGPIVAIDGDRMAQKIGRDPANVVWHDVAKLSRVPALNEMAEIKYDANGRGEVKSNVQEMSR